MTLARELYHFLDCCGALPYSQNASPFIGRSPDSIFPTNQRSPRPTARIPGAQRRAWDARPLRKVRTSRRLQRTDHPFERRRSRQLTDCYSGAPVPARGVTVRTAPDWVSVTDCTACRNARGPWMRGNGSRVPPLPVITMSPKSKARPMKL
jgi:hypothetical protein